MGVADSNTKNAIDAAKAALGTAAPIATGLVGGQQARDDANAILDGKATPQQVARVQAALTRWTPEELSYLPMAASMSATDLPSKACIKDVK